MTFAIVQKQILDLHRLQLNLGPNHFLTYALNFFIGVKLLILFVRELHILGPKIFRIHICPHMLVRENFKTSIVKSDITDHFPIYFVSKPSGKNIQLQTTEICKCVYNSEAIKSFKQRLHQTNWDEIKSNENANDDYKKFLEIFIKIYDEFFPKIKIKLR